MSEKVNEKQAVARKTTKRAREAAEPYLLNDVIVVTAESFT